MSKNQEKEQRNRPTDPSNTGCIRYRVYKHNATFREIKHILKFSLSKALSCSPLRRLETLGLPVVFTLRSSGRVSSHARTQPVTSSTPHSSPSPLRSAQKELGYFLSRSHGWTTVESSMSHYRMVSFPQWTVGSCESKACLFFFLISLIKF